MPKKKSLTFEASLSRLSEIIGTVESGDTSLDDAITLYKEGLALAQDCGAVLSVYESEVLQLQKSTDDMFKLTPFEN